MRSSSCGPGLVARPPRGRRGAMIGRARLLIIIGGQKRTTSRQAIARPHPLWVCADNVKRRKIQGNMSSGLLPGAWEASRGLTRPDPRLQDCQSAHGRLSSQPSPCRDIT